VTDKPPPFANYLPVSADDIWKTILAGDVAAHIYSTKARGDFEPIAISAAEFFMAEQAGRDEDGEPDPALKPFQIMWCDRDSRRPASLRYRVPVPHWVYVLKAPTQEAPPDRPKGPAKARVSRTPPEQARAQAILQTLFGNTRPPELGFSDLLKRINDHIGKTGRPITKDTLRRTLKSK